MSAAVRQALSPRQPVHAPQCSQQYHTAITGTASDLWRHFELRCWRVQHFLCNGTLSKIASSSWNIFQASFCFYLSNCTYITALYWSPGSLHNSSLELRFVTRVAWRLFSYGLRPEAVFVSFARDGLFLFKARIYQILLIIMAPIYWSRSIWVAVESAESSSYNTTNNRSHLLCWAFCEIVEKITIFISNAYFINSRGSNCFTSYCVKLVRAYLRSKIICYHMRKVGRNVYVPLGVREIIFSKSSLYSEFCRCCYFIDHPLCLTLAETKAPIYI